MKKRTVAPFYGKREQRIEKQIANTQALAACVLDLTQRKLLHDKVTEMKADVVNSMAKKFKVWLGTTHAPWAPMPRKGFHMERVDGAAMEVANV
ncbi:hypothetical protein ACN9MB_08955 [Dyella kyungheensis]|uniref:hypothetical protein n=1 Tax=Dyella kyungheensis TaxID=1242174 RepID=UPI003CECAD18